MSIISKSYIANCDSLFYLVRYLDVCIRFFLRFPGQSMLVQILKLPRKCREKYVHEITRESVGLNTCNANIWCRYQDNFELRNLVFCCFFVWTVKWNFNGHEGG